MSEQAISEILDDLRMAVYWLNTAVEPHAASQNVIDNLAKAADGIKRLRGDSRPLPGPHEIS